MPITGRFVAGLCIGTIAGASLAMVLVPVSPSEMRDRLRAIANTNQSPDA